MFALWVCITQYEKMDKNVDQHYAVQYWSQRVSDTAPSPINKPRQMAPYWQQALTGVSITFNELVHYRKCFVLITCSAAQAEADKQSFLSTLRKRSVRVMDGSFQVSAAALAVQECDRDGTHAHNRWVEIFSFEKKKNAALHKKGKGQMENVSISTKRMALGLETSFQLHHGLSLGENPLVAADCALEHNPNKGLFTLKVYWHPSYALDSFQPCSGYIALKDQDKVECFLKQSLNGAILPKGCQGPAASGSKHRPLSSTCISDWLTRTFCLPVAFFSSAPHMTSSPKQELPPTPQVRKEEAALTDRRDHTREGETCQRTREESKR